MSKEQFETKRAAIEALTSNEINEPAIPVSVALQEAEDLYEWCQEDKESLAEAGLDLTLVDDLPLRVGACRYAQSIWQKEYKSIEEAQKEWLKKSPVAYGLRDDLLHHFVFGYRKMPDLLSKVQKISEGNGHADMIQDLSDLAVLGTGNPEPLKKINFDLKLLDTASQTSEEMSVLLAKTNGERLSDNKLKIIRDKAYTHVKQAVDEIRNHGQYIFYRNDDRKKGYVSRYVKTHFTRAKKDSKKADNPGE